MIKMIMMLALLISCGKKEESKHVSAADVQQKEETLLESAFKVRIKTVNFSVTNKTKVLKAAELIRQVMNSEEFKNEILDGRFTDTMGLTNLEIYEKIMSGAEVLSPKKDQKMDLVLETFYADAITVGYTMTGSPTIYMNTKFLNRQNPEQVTTNLVHEWLHKVGFTHDEEFTPSRSSSVPYAVGYIVRRLAKEL